MEYLAPKVGDVVKLQFKDPFNTEFSGKPMKVVTISSIPEMMSILNVTTDEFFKVSYELYSIEKNMLIDDMNNNVPMIEFRDINGVDKYYIPNSYVKSIALMDGINYVGSIISIKLPALPEYMKFSKLILDLKSMVKDVLGVDDVLVGRTLYNRPDLITHEKHTLDNNVRLGKVVTEETYIKKLEDKDVIIASQRETIRDLNNHILTIDV